MKILYIDRRDKNHSKFGGYDYITGNDNSTYFDCEKTIFGKIPSGIPGRGILMYFTGFLYSLIKKNDYDIIHFFYGDFMLFFKVPYKSRAKFICTIHLNTNKYSKRKLKILNSFFSVIVLCKSEAENLCNKGIKSVAFIPHGFNKPVFNFSEKIDEKIDRNKINIFFSGNNYRDFDTLDTILHSFEKKRPDIVFHLVGQKESNKKRFSIYSNAIIYDRLDDNEYYSLLKICNYNFLPLLFATANNALLEAQALGVISILPNISGINDYADINGNLYYTDINSLIKIIEDLSLTKEKKSLIDYSNNFLWNSVYLKLNTLYSKNT